MSTTYWIADPRFLDREELEKVERWNLPKAEICTIKSSIPGMYDVILWMDPLDFESYPNDTKLFYDNGDGAKNLGELKQVIEGALFKINKEEFLEANREHIKKIILSLPNKSVDPAGKVHDFRSLKERVKDPFSDLSDLF